MIQKYSTTFLRREEIADGTMKCVFKKPENFTFTAGQYVVLTIDAPSFTEPGRLFRSLSIASAPCEEELFFIMRHSESAFKKSLAAMKEGDTITLAGPLGHFVLPDDKGQSIVFLVAGVGITPVRSMLVQSEYEKSQRPMTLLCSNREAKAAPCLHEMMGVNLAQYICMHTMTDASDGWDGPVGKITAQSIKDCTQNLENPLFYIVGTKGFIDGMKEQLGMINVSHDRMILDNFG